MNELSYATPGPSGRPGYLTALGIVSIVVGSLGALVNGFGAIGAVIMAIIGPRMGTFTAAATMVTTVPTTGPTTAPIAAPAAPPMPLLPAIAVRPQIASAAISVASLFVAILLLVAGIQLLRDRRIARPLHWWFVALKVPLSLAYAAVSTWISVTMMSGMRAQPAMAGARGATPSLWVMAASTALFSLAFSLAYPIALLIVLPRKNTKEYFNGLAE